MLGDIVKVKSLNKEGLVVSITQPDSPEPFYLVHGNDFILHCLFTDLECSEENYMAGFFRYPGGKGKLEKEIVNNISNFLSTHSEFKYGEVFLGGGSTALALLKRPEIKNMFILNDKDYGIASIWNAIIKEPTELCSRIKAFKPTPEAFYEFKDFLKSDKLKLHDFIDVAFKKIAIHQISYSGLGTMAGGPIGGLSQSSDYKVDCRWNAESLSLKILTINSNFKSRIIDNNCTFHDFEYIINNNQNILFYLDPPYYVKGPELYEKSFTKEDHERLSKSLKETSCPWILSYDNCDEVKALYDWADIKEIDINYTITTSRQNTELIITPKTFPDLMKVPQLNDIMSE